MGLVSNFPSMGKWIGAGILVTLICLQFLSKVEGKSILPQQLQVQGSPDDKPGALNPEMDVGDDEQAAAMEVSLLNYLYNKQVQRMRQQFELTDPVRKRNYWKQCAFNAVSCFG